jgi:hypothetical protein
MPQNARAARALVLAVACVAVVCFVCTLNDERQAASVRESRNAMDNALTTIDTLLAAEQSQSGATDVVDQAMDEIENAFNNGQVPDAAKAAPAKPMDKAHKNLVNLKAYSVAVHSKVSDMLSHKHSSVIPFINAFGKDPNNKNIILEYSKIFAQTSDAYDSGLGRYMLHHMNDAVLNGNGVVATPDHGKHYVLDNTVLGLQTLPNYMKKLKVSVMHYTEAQGKMTKLSENADTYAAAQYLRGKHAKAYESFLDREIARVDALSEAHEHGYVLAAFDAEVTAYKTSYAANTATKLLHVAVQPPAGMEAAQGAVDADKWVAPSINKIRAAAKANAALFMKNLHAKLSGTAEVVKNQEAQNMGVTITMTSSQYLDGESSQTPTVVVKGSKGTLTGTLQALPLPGKTISQTFASKHLIGELKSVEFQASSNDPWSCDHIQVAVGELPAVPMQQTRFWLVQPTPAGQKGPVVNHQGMPFAAKWVLTPA